MPRTVHPLPRPSTRPSRSWTSSRGTLREAASRALSIGLRSALVGSCQRARQPHAMARHLAPGLYEQIELETANRGLRRVPTFEELGSVGLGPASLHRIARRNTCAMPFEVSVTGPRPGTRVWMVGAPSPADAAPVVLELPRLVPAWRAPWGGFLLAVPIRGTALYLPLGGDPTDALARAGRLGELRVADLHAPLDVHASADYLAHWGAHLFARLPEPVSPEVYWVRENRLQTVPRGVRNGRHELRPGPRLRRALMRARETGLQGY